MQYTSRLMLNFEHHPFVTLWYSGSPYLLFDFFKGKYFSEIMNGINSFIVNPCWFNDVKCWISFYPSGYEMYQEIVQSSNFFECVIFHEPDLYSAAKDILNVLHVNKITRANEMTAEMLFNCYDPCLIENIEKLINLWNIQKRAFEIQRQYDLDFLFQPKNIYTLLLKRTRLIDSGLGIVDNYLELIRYLSALEMRHGKFGWVRKK